MEGVVGLDGLLPPEQVAGLAGLKERRARIGAASAYGGLEGLVNEVVGTKQGRVEIVDLNRAPRLVLERDRAVEGGVNVGERGAAEQIQLTTCVQVDDAEGDSFAVAQIGQRAD